MANTAKFKRREVLEKATRLFWQKGFHATSTRDIQQAIDMRPGSIYAAFGSKAGLFREVLRFYAADMSEQLAQSLATEDTIVGGLQAFFRRVLLKGGKDAPSELCLLAKSLSELDEEEGELLRETRALLAGTEAEFRSLVEAAIARGELPARTGAALLARQLQIQLIGLRSYLRATGDRAAVGEIVEHLFDGSMAGTPGGRS
ncbi:TetR/AcrR family transcriptional regulator [Microbulbifer yueqingensis]|uniref:Transcriptional regulator, TetR family n=1 Tax=Microbulbifer yueqingensis TaxID=658219 RepID=A0A1G9BKJ3_9GAMM|nr:TetR/AcrR family transcriptional regulator [Microbulbifer yueqingensis]SDK40049.1 transcriptional regulator, TetR family [Microbulbifer yueqingensis]